MDDLDISKLNAAERIEVAVRESRRQQERINQLREANRNETRPVVVEENRREIERLEQEHEEYDEMTRAGFTRYMDSLNDIISRLTPEKARAPLSDKKEIMLSRAIQQRNRLLELSRDNGDILPFIQPDRTQGNDDRDSEVQQELNELDKFFKEKGKEFDASKYNEADIKEMYKFLKECEKIKVTGKEVNITDITNIININNPNAVTIINLYFGNVININNGRGSRPPRPPRTKEEIEEEIKHFNDVCDRIEADIVKILESLVYDEKFKETVALAAQLDAEFAELRGLADKLREEIGEFKDANFGKEDFSLSITAMERKLTEFRKKLREIKKTQMEHYNSKVTALNARINDLKAHINDEGLSDEDRKKIAELAEMKLAQGSYFNPGNLKYLDSIDYDKLLELTKTVEEIEAKIGRNHDENIDLEADMKKIEEEIKDIESKIKDEMTQDEINALFEKIGVVSYLIVIFTNKLEANKDKLSEEQYNQYQERIQKAKDALNALREKLGKVNVEGRGNVNQDFEGLKRELDILEAQIDTFTMMIRPQSIVESDVPNLEGDLKNFEDSLEAIIEKIEEKHKDGKIDDNQFNTLMEQAKRIQEKIALARAKLNDPKFVKNFDIFDRIKNLELDITALEKFIDSLEAPIKDKRIRKKIDKEIERLEQEIKSLRLAAEKLKEKEPDKYEEAMKQIDEQEKRLEAVSKKYRKKCPFLVRTAKSAKNFYKKHKKAVLIAAGLASLALIHATLGPILGPAMIHGNLMIMNKVPALRPVLAAINGVIRKLVGAKEVMIEGTLVTQLKNGVIVNPACAAVSLLKGISIVGLSSAAIATPIIIMIKELIKKMKKHEIKEKVEKEEKKKSKKEKKEKKKEKKEKGKIKEKVGEVKKKVTDKVTDKVKEQKEKREKRKDDKEFLERMKNLLIQYRESQLSLDEFAEANELSDEDKSILAAYDGGRSGGRK